MKIARVAVSAATYGIDRPYDYLIPEEFALSVQPGMRVYVPFSRGNRISEGIVLAVTDSSEYSPDKLKPVSALIDEEPVLTSSQLQLALFISERFFCTVYSAVRAILPAGFWFDNKGKKRVHDKTVEYANLVEDAEYTADYADKIRRKSPKQAEILDLLCSFESLPTSDILHYVNTDRNRIANLEKKGLISFVRKEVYRRPDHYEGDRLPFPVLNEEQQKVYDGINELAHLGSPKAALLHGITGSGKTSVYIHLIRQQLEDGRSCILLVPEIALTPQMLEFFGARFGDEIAVLHSSLTPGERYDEWKRIRSGEARLVIGTRSAVFAPAQNLGLIIIDEEQESSYKSESNPRYNVRDVAKFICAREKILLLMGSATPDLVSMHHALSGRYSLFRLRKRFNDQQLPEVKIVDMKQELRDGNSSCFSRYLLNELRKNIDNGEQSIFFINRRGANKLVTCVECGYKFECPRCSVSLTYHSNNNRMMCHYCGYSTRTAQRCPDCGGTLKYFGVGTQSVENELKSLIPGIEVMRVDADTVMPAGSHEPLFDRFRTENIPVMVGTQMVAKGLNFENVTLVGVISADQSLCAGDYRAGERTFSLLTQVVGRSGRGAKSGRAVIQTYTPLNETIVHAASQDYESFYEEEMKLRELQQTPPFSELIAVSVSGTDETAVLNGCFQLKERLKSALGPNVKILGPVSLPVVKVNNRYRYKLNIVCSADAQLRNSIANLVRQTAKDKKFNHLSVFAAYDPVD